MSPWERLEGPGWWNRGPTRPPPAPSAPQQGGHCPLGPFSGAQAGRGGEAPPGTSGVPLNPGYPSAEGSGVGLVPLPGCAGAVPNANHNLRCQGAAVLQPPSRWALSLLPAGVPWAAAPPKPHFGDRLCPQPHSSSGAPQVFLLWSPQINLSPWSWPEWCDLKGSCGPRCPSANPLHLGSVPWEPRDGVTRATGPIWLPAASPSPRSAAAPLTQTPVGFQRFIGIKLKSVPN